MSVPTLQSGMQIVQPDTGQPNPHFVQWWNGLAHKAATAVVQRKTAAWATPTGTLNRTTFVAYAGQTVSATPTQAQVQAIDDAVKLLSQHLAALISDLRANGTLT